MAQSETLPSLLAIFDILEKAKLVEHCRSAVITGTDLANLILACETYKISIRHLPVFQHHHPAHLNLQEHDRRALVENGVGLFKPAARKAANKVTAMFDQRRLFCGHMFWPPEFGGEWHLLYFDQRDTAEHDNHWEHGSHIHLMNMVTHPRLDPNKLVESLFATERPKLGGSLHVRYKR